MATEVLHSRDLLAERFRVPPTAFHRRRNLAANRNAANLALNRRQHRKVSPKPDNRSRFDAAEAKRSSYGGDGDGGSGLVMGQVTLLRRGEPLGSISPKEPAQTPAVLGSVSPPEIVLKQIRLVAAPPPDVYAGSGFFMSSPSPRSVPLPSFFSKKEPENCDLSEDDATRDLRRILRLE